MKTDTNYPTKTAATTVNIETRNAMPAKRFIRTTFLFVALLAVVCLVSGVRAGAQTANASLTGIVADDTGARLPGAMVVIINQSTRDKRTNVANSSGVFNFSALSPGTYTLTVTHKGFEIFQEKDIALHPGDSGSLPTIGMKVGAENITITVSAHDSIAVDGEVSSLITAEDIQHLATQSRDVTELVKILPGFALQPGLASGGGLSNAAPNQDVVGPGGSLGSYAATGAPSNGVGLISDGANVQDPGAGGASTQNINMDMVEEVKISTSNFGADTAKGPVVINAVGKSGGATYHGAIYMIARLHQLNSQDWLLKNQGLPKPEDRYLYPGANIGGPIVIPGTNFNHAKKLLFEVGGEDYVQRNVFSGGSASNALRLSTVPTDAMRGLQPCPTGQANGGYTGNCANFSQASLENLFNVPAGDLAANCTATGTLSVFQNYCQTAQGIDPQGNTIANGYFPAADIDPGAQAYLKIFPHQNRQAQKVAGTSQESDGFDRIDLNLTNYNLYQVRGRIDYNASQNNKVYFVYNTEQGTNYQPYTFYYNPTNGSGIIRDPSLIHSGTNSQTASANYVRVMGPTLTNEFFVAAAYYLNSFSAVNEASQTTAALGYPYSNVLNNGSKQLPQLGYSSGVPLYLSPDFSISPSFSRKVSVDFGDNVTKVYKQHTIKVGFYFERTANNQLTALGPTQGSFAEYGLYATFQVPRSPGSTTYQAVNPMNTIANFELGFVNSYSQQTSNPLIDLNYKAIDGFVTDSWKATRKMTLTGGVRFDHLGPWVDPHGNGAAFWSPENYYTPQLAYGTNPGIALNQLPGITWHGINHNVTSAVQLGRWAFVSPRVGFSYDVYGSGRTVFTGGAGLYRSHDSWNDYTNAVGTAMGAYTVSFNGGGSAPTLKCISELGKGTAGTDLACTGGTATGAAPSLSGQTVLANQSPSFYVADPKDDQQPLTTTYSVGVNQAINHAGNFVVNYVANQSSHLFTSNGFAQNVNTIKQGGLFAPNPNPYDTVNYGVIAAQPDNIPYVDDYRPFPLYNSIYEARHGLHSSYQSLQTTLSKYNGRFHYNLNYTWSKALGDRGASGSGSVADATNVRNDYGIMAYDRTHIFNASYSYIEGNAFHVNRFIGGFVNGWEISGILNLQSGPNLQAAYSSNLGLTLTGSTAVGTTPTDNKTYLGTPDITLQPIMTCDPSINLHKNQFINGACLTLGPQGVNGPFRYPYLRGPAYFHTDLSGQKSFHLGGKKELRLRFAAFNFVNHPLTSLVAATASPLKLVISGPGQPANSAFGISAYKEGHRTSEIDVHYIF